MPDRRHKGNTLSEYSLLIALIAVASIGAIAALGNSVNLSFMGLGDSLKRDSSNTVAVNGMTSNLNETNAGIGQVAGSTSLSSVTSINSSIKLNGNSSGETNVTSVAGDKDIQSVHKTLSLTQKFEQMAQETSDPQLKAWYSLAAQYGLHLAGSEATYSVQTNPNGSQQLSALAFNGPEMAQNEQYQLKPGGDAIWNMFNFFHQLSTLSMDYPKGKDPVQKAQDLAMIKTITDSALSGYGDSLGKYVSYNPTNGIPVLDQTALQRDYGHLAVSFEPSFASRETELKGTASTLLDSGSLDSTPAIKASVSGSTTLSTKSKEGHDRQ